MTIAEEQRSYETYICPSCQRTLKFGHFAKRRSGKILPVVRHELCDGCRPARAKVGKTLRRKPEPVMRQPMERLVVRRQLLQMFGRRCERCGYDEFESALEFHHKVASEKKHPISDLIARYCRSGFTADWELLLAEVKKCKILCSNCHQAFHHDDWRELPGKGAGDEN